MQVSPPMQYDQIWWFSVALNDMRWFLFVFVIEGECVNSWENQSWNISTSWCSLNLYHHCDSNFFMMRCLWKYSTMSIKWKWYTVKTIIMIIQTTIINSIPIMEHFFVLSFCPLHIRTWPVKMHQWFMNKEIKRGLEWHEGEYMMSKCFFLGGTSL